MAGAERRCAHQRHLPDQVAWLRYSGAGLRGRERLKAENARLQGAVADLGVELAFLTERLKARDAEVADLRPELDLVHARLQKAGVDFVRLQWLVDGPVADGPQTCLSALAP